MQIKKYNMRSIVLAIILIGVGTNLIVTQVYALALANNMSISSIDRLFGIAGGIVGVVFGFVLLAIEFQWLVLKEDKERK